MAIIIDFKNAAIGHTDDPIVQDVNLQVEEGSFVYLTGRVGSGKSSLLKTMYGELPVRKGSVTMLGTYEMNSKLKDKKRQELRRQLGIVFQDFKLLGDRTIEKNLDFVLQATGWKKKKERYDRITEVLQLVGLEDKRTGFPSELSGGEQQRICIARAILNKPRLILADEPTGNMDMATCKSIMELLHTICKEHSTVVMSTHNLGIISSYPGIVYKIENREMTDITEELNRPFDMVELNEMD